jgi:hypothetical protein
MWRAECQECDFTVSRLTRAEADPALVAHIQATKHQAWLMVPVPDRPEVADQTPRPTDDEVS